MQSAFISANLRNLREIRGFTQISQMNAENNRRISASISVNPRNLREIKSFTQITQMNADDNKKKEYNLISAYLR